MSAITYYKLQSPYSEDITKDCKLTMTEIDENFLAFKDNDISAATFDSESYHINLIKNNSDTIDIDISNIKDYILNTISASTSGDSSDDFDIQAELSSEGVLTLKWGLLSGQSQASISGFVTSVEEIYTDSTTISGKGTHDNPLRLSNLEKTSRYKQVLGIVDELPYGSSVKRGDRYITKVENSSNFGALYSKDGLELIKAKLETERLPWRIPTKDDWDKLLNATEVCETEYFSDINTIEQGNISGKCLKSVDLWGDNENLDKYGFSVLPTFSANEYKELSTSVQNAIFWTSTECENGGYYMKEFLSDKDNIRQTVSEDGHMYSIRLVMDYDDSLLGFNANIFGKEYELVPMPSVNQIWIKTNLDFSFDSEDYSKKYLYSGDNRTTKYYINHWNGVYWEKKELNDGDAISVKGIYNTTEYHVVDDTNGNSNLVKTLELTPRNAIYDAGWYGA